MSVRHSTCSGGVRLQTASQQASAPAVDPRGPAFLRLFHSSSSAFLSPVGGRAVRSIEGEPSPSRGMAPPILLYISTPVIRTDRRSKCPFPVRAISNLSSHLISLSATRMHVRHAAIPGMRIIRYPTTIPPFASSIAIPTVHPTVRSPSPKVYSRMPAAVQAFQLSPFP